ASTLTLQLVRVLEQRPRTLRSKLVEAFRALQLELRMSKRDILSAYLQHVPYGGNVEGIESAALAYFGHRATALAPAEIATLLAVPQSPSRRAPSAANAERLRTARDQIAERLVAARALPPDRRRVSPEEILAQVRATAVPTAPRPFPREAPHVAYWLRDRALRAGRLRTTLERGVQRIAERGLSELAADARHKGIHDAAVVIVEHASGEVRALVGGFDFWNGAQIPAFAVPRSPGSALKPFVYALAIDRGLALPEHLLPDVPVSYGGYSPRNYDGSYAGLVTLEDALSRSLNVPFVNLLREIGTEAFLAELRGMGVHSLSPEPGHYGLSAVVGGIELTAMEVAGIYATLARDGALQPLRWTPAMGRDRSSPRAFSPGAAFLTRRALSLKDRPDFPARLRYTAHPRRIHWKTGTSFGNRDAWSVGSGPRYTAVVWLGNLDNRGSSELVGAEAAAPVLFDVLEALGSNAGASGGEAVPADLTDVEVCAYSGHLPGSACPVRRTALARKTAVPTRRCPYHVNIDVDVDSGRALTPSCRGSHRWETRTFLEWPASVRRFLDDQHRRWPSPPVLAEGCTPGGARIPPAIVSPAPGQVALLLRGVPPEKQELPLEAESPSATAVLSWFINGEYLGKAPAHERLWWTPRPGRHEIVVSDEAGGVARRTFDVRHRL
ncbi:MAG TPA: penicillin-binding protein 1C, partial [Myxococcaceae bacterium]|nr:penicillin-binding protein 1C [Myxococcaceae bacterium]